MRAKSLVTGFALLFLFLALGEAVARVAGLPIPGSVLGMMFLAGALVGGVVRAEWVARVADGLLEHLGLLFVPPGVGVMLHFGLIRREWLPITVSLLVSTILVMVVTGGAAEWLRRRTGGERE